MIKKLKTPLVIGLISVFFAAICIFGTIVIMKSKGEFSIKEYAEYQNYKNLDKKGYVLNEDQAIYLIDLSNMYGRTYELQKTIENSFYKDTSQIDFSLGASKGIVEQLNDPYSYYLSEEELIKLKENMNSEYVGIGVVVSPTEDGYITVVSPFIDSPAEKAGIKPLDKVVAVNGERLTGEQLSKAVELIRGEVGSEVTVTFMREDLEFEVVFIRDTIKVETVYSELIQNDIGYIAISQFARSTGEEFSEHLKKLEEENDIKGLIIDLRYNPGGELGSLLDIADLLLGEQTIITLENKQGEVEKYESDDEHKYDGQIVVLVNNGSASASEALTGAIKDTKSGIIVGIRTFGKGVAQSLIPIGDNNALNLTTAEYFTPNGTNVNKEGIEPDIIIEDDLETEQDEQLDKAIEKMKELLKN